MDYAPLMILAAAAGAALLMFKKQQIEILSVVNNKHGLTVVFREDKKTVAVVREDSKWYTVTTCELLDAERTKRLNTALKQWKENQ